MLECNTFETSNTYFIFIFLSEETYLIYINYYYSQLFDTI